MSEIEKPVEEVPVDAGKPPKAPRKPRAKKADPMDTVVESDIKPKPKPKAKKSVQETPAPKPKKEKKERKPLTEAQKVALAKGQEKLKELREKKKKETKP